MVFPTRLCVRSKHCKRSTVNMWFGCVKCCLTALDLCSCLSTCCLICRRLYATQIDRWLKLRWGCIYSHQNCLHGSWTCTELSGHWHLFVLVSSFFTARCYAERGIAMASCLSVRLSVCLSVTLRYCDYIGWKSSKIISWLVSLGCSLFATPTSRGYSKGNTPKFLPE